MRARIFAAAIAITLLLSGFGLTAQAQESLKEHRPGELLVRFAADVEEGGARGRLQGAGGKIKRRFKFLKNLQADVNRYYHVELPEGVKVEKAIELFSKLPGVEVVQPNYVKRKVGAPNDPSYASLWGLQNTAQAGNRGTLAPVADADLDWPEAWDLIDQRNPTQGQVIVAVIDTGVNYLHPDLAPVMWTNPNGATDGLHGWDFANNDNDPMDDDGHGTHCSGTIAGAGDNGIGVIGVARRNVRIMAMKFLGADGSGSTADAIDCINYAVARGARVLNNSWGGGPFEQALYDAITAANNAGAVFVAAAGNDYSDNDAIVSYPAGYNRPNVLSVAASTRHERVAEFSNWGKTTVDLAAPGEEILSTILGTGYAFYDGTSMATPHVSGAMAVLYSIGFTGTPAQAIALAMDSTDPCPAYAGKMVSEGRLNLAHMVTRHLGADTFAPAAITDLRLAVAAPTAVTLKFTATGDDGASGAVMRYDLRYGPSAGFQFDAATRVGGGFVPAHAGATQYMPVAGLAAATSYTFQLRAIDDGGNAVLSNAFTTQTAPADPAGFTDGMETGTNGWTTNATTSTLWARTTAQKRSGSTSWTDSPSGNYPKNQASNLVSPAISLAGAGAATLTFWQRYDVETSYDFCTVQASTNGTTWTTLATYTGANTAWHQVTLNLSAYIGAAPVLVRFRLTSDASVHRDGWYVDDVVVSKGPGLTTVLSLDCNTPAPFTLEHTWGIEAGNYLADSPGANYGLNVLSMAGPAAAIDLSQASRATLSFDLSYAFEVYQGIPYDELWLEMSTDRLRWFPLQRYGGTRGFARESFDLTRFAGAPQAYLRFVVTTDYDVVLAGAQINDIRVEVAPYLSPNGAPNAVDDGPYFANEEAPLAVPAALGLLGNDSDLEGDALTASLVGQPSNGSVSIQGDGSFTFTSGPDFAGTATFTYRVSDPLGAQDTATVTIIVANVNDAPVAQSAAKAATEDAAAAGTLGATDADGDALSYEVISGPSHGAVLLAGAGYTYTPAPNYSGEDAFTWSARDGALASNAATISITVAPVNDAPVASDASKGATEDVDLVDALSAADVDGDALTYQVTGGPTHGSVALNGAGYTYTPAPNYHGPDAFSWRARDGSLDSNAATVSISVAPANDAPTATGGTLSTDINAPADGTLSGSDIDGDALTFSVATGPAHGSVTLAGGAGPGYTYTPEPGYSGADAFTFTASDGTATSGAATVSITVLRVNVAPLALGGSLATDEDTPAAGALDASDADGDALTFEVTSGPQHGSVQLTGASYTYTPAAHWSGGDSFTFRVHDGQASSSDATVTISVAPIADAPIASGAAAATSEDTPLAGALSASDADGDALTFIVVAGPAHGSVQLSGAGYSYTPASNYHGSDAFTFRASDGGLASNEATITLTIASVNDAPIASDGAGGSFEDLSVVGTLAASDADGDALTYALLSGPANGTVQLFGASYLYTPVGDWNGEDAFTFQVGDGQALSSIATVLITIEAVNDAPVAAADAATTNAGQATVANVLGNDTDADGDVLVIAWVGIPSGGTASDNGNGTITFTPAAGFSGAAAFSYSVSDGHGGFATGQVTVTVLNPTPIVIAGETFESNGWSGGAGFTGAWTRSGDNAIASGSAHGGTYQARLRSSTGLVSRRINMLGVTGAKLRVWLRGQSFESGETATVRVSTNGTTYTTVKTFTQSEANNTWRFFEIDLSGYAMTSTFRIAFDANMSATNDSFYVDDIEVVGIR